MKCKLIISELISEFIGKMIDFGDLSIELDLPALPRRGDVIYLKGVHREEWRKKIISLGRYACGVVSHYCYGKYSEMSGPDMGTDTFQKLLSIGYDNNEEDSDFLNFEDIIYVEEIYFDYDNSGEYYILIAMTDDYEKAH
ncbi:MAG: hypothetical protein LBK58_13085 [Prevotellaceae bacterium]|jgi:hypothetical protein|nr:hypothetical protein [Prevotellaceae bacterium]